MLSGLPTQGGAVTLDLIRNRSLARRRSAFAELDLARESLTSIQAAALCRIMRKKVSDTQ